MEDCNMAHYNTLQITKEEFERSIRDNVSDYIWKNIRYSIKDYFEGKINENQLFDAFIQNIGERQAYKIFPFFISTVENNATVKELDNFFYNAILRLPKKVNFTILFSSY